MKKSAMKLVLATLVAGMSLPLTAQAADDDLQARIDKLSKEVAELKGSVKKVEDKSIGKWLTIGGEYRFRMDSLHGETKAYSDAVGTMGTMVGGFLNDPNIAGVSGNPSALRYIMAGKTG